MPGNGSDTDGRPVLNGNGDMLGKEPRNTESTHLTQNSQTVSLDYKVRAYVYASHFLSAWGDRMWQFGVGMFMVIIAPDSLRLTATYGLCMGTAILIFGAHVGNMVDRVPRMSAARWTLIIQNLSVAVCAAIIYFVIIYKPQIETFWPDEGLLNLCYAGIILVAIISSLASTGNTIAVERDWIAEICGKNEDMLASMSATLKGIDLTTNIVAPIATGQIMAYGGVDIGAIFIGAWNVVSVFVEYYLLWKVYNSIPALRVDKGRREKEETSPTVDDAPLSNSTNVDTASIVLAKSLQLSQSPDLENRPEQTGYDRQNSAVTTDGNTCTSCLRGLFSGITILIRGWRTFMKYDVAFAGLALSTLYMTVLGFDNITVGYAYTQGVNESIMGILMAAGAAVGILGTIIFPRMRRCFGLVRTGLLGLFLQISISSLCIVSIWAPGSPFDPLFRNNKTPDHNNGTSDNITTNADTNLNSTNISSPSSNSIGPVVSNQESDVSIIIMLAGIVGSRCGLWITDLTITQLFLMRVHETERGVVLGVQTSLNQLMDMLKFVIVIVAPEPEVFGILVLISFGFVCSGWILYAKYARSVRGHLFHFNKILTLCGNKYVRLPDTLTFKP